MITGIILRRVVARYQKKKKKKKKDIECLYDISVLAFKRRKRKRGKRGKIEILPHTFAVPTNEKR